MKKIILGILFLSSVAFSKETILVQGAMDMEIDYLVKNLSNPVKEQIASWTFWKGKMGDNTVIVSRTEIGLTNASAATVLGIEKYTPTIIINQGTAGGHDPELHAGDIVIGKEIVNFGAVRTERKEYGVSENSRDGIFFDVVQRLRDDKENMQENKRFYSNAELMKTAEKTDYSNGKVVEGVIGTADQWNRELERIKYIHEVFNTSAEEMETSAAAQVAKAYNIPFLGVRVLSNTDIHNEDFNPKTALWCQEYVVSIIKNIKSK